MIATLPFTQGRVARPVVLAGGLLGILGARLALNGNGAMSAFLAGIVFGSGLVGLAVATGWRTRRPGSTEIGFGLAGGVVLIALPLIARAGSDMSAGLRPEPFAFWVVVTTIVAIGEEAVLRGVFFGALRVHLGLPATIVVTSVAFALLHVPLYGWHVVPLDLAVGIWLAGLRLVSGGIAAPAIAHTLADLATWWL